MSKHKTYRYTNEQYDFFIVKISEGNNVVFWTATFSNNIDFTIEALITLVVILKYKKTMSVVFNNFGFFSIRFRHAIQKVWSKDFIDFIFWGVDRKQFSKF